MVDIQSKEVIDKISQDLKVQPALQIPRELAKQIQLVYSVNAVPVANIFENETRTTTTGASNIFMTPTNRDFFLTHVYLHNVSDATADNTIIRLIVTKENGVQVDIIAFSKITTTAFSATHSITFNTPIKLLRGTNITFVNAFTVGVSVSDVNFSGFTIDPQ